MCSALGPVDGDVDEVHALRVAHRVVRRVALCRTVWDRVAGSIPYHIIRYSIAFVVLYRII